jgi:hypothetical protein
MWADPDKAWVSSSCLKVCNPSMEPVKPHLVGGMRLESYQSLYWSHREKVNTLLAGTVMFRVPPGYKVPCKTFTRIVDGPAGTVGWRSFQDFPTCSCDRRRIFNMLRSSKCQSINIWNKHPCQIKFDKMRPIGLPFRRRTWKPWQFSNWPFIRRMTSPFLGNQMIARTSATPRTLPGISQMWVFGMLSMLLYHTPQDYPEGALIAQAKLGTRELWVCYHTLSNTQGVSGV